MGKSAPPLGYDGMMILTSLDQSRGLQFVKTVNYPHRLIEIT